MNRESNAYTLIFASVMVIIVALLLSGVHEGLKDTQNRNVEIDKMSQILRSIKIETSGNDAVLKYEEYITDVFLVDSEGNRTDDSKETAFNTELKTELTRNKDQRKYPVFETKINGETKYILALSGKGLWGDLWGFIAINNDGNTIYGADFSHAGETPGLGAEIVYSWFSDQFIGKRIFIGDDFKSVAIVKTGKSLSDRDYVDGISGGTITGRGVEDMIHDSLEGYSNFLKKLQQQ